MSSTKLRNAKKEKAIEYLGDLFTSDTIYGVGELRNDAAVAFIVPAT